MSYPQTAACFTKIKGRGAKQGGWGGRNPPPLHFGEGDQPPLILRKKILIAHI